MLGLYELINFFQLSFIHSRDVVATKRFVCCLFFVFFLYFIKKKTWFRSAEVIFE